MNPLKRGDKVRVKKGALIHSLNPKFDAMLGLYEAKKNYEITIDYVLDGYPPLPGYAGKKDSIVWAGSGGYWCQVDNDDVEVIN